MSKVKIKCTIELDENRLKDLLTTALEGGSNYWYTIDEDKTVYADGLCYEDFREGGKCTDPDRYQHPYEIIPFTEGCAIFIEDKFDEGMSALLNREKLLKGLQIMANDYPRQFTQVIEEKDNGDTGDVYLQCCLFGEAIYG